MIFGTLATSCKKEDEEKHCYVCDVQVTMKVGGQDVPGGGVDFEECDLTHAEAAELSKTVTATQDGVTTTTKTTCTRK